VEELRAFFRTRGVAFGSADDLKPFVERLDADAGFRDEIASMMREIIYRERDGLSWPELVGLLTAAVGGEHVEDAESAEVREVVRRLMGFVENVFRTRRNPGAASGAVQGMAAPEPEFKETASAEGAPVEHPAMDVFYRARMAAQEEEETSFAKERRTEFPKNVEAAGDSDEPETVLHADPGYHVPLEDFEYRETAERGSPVWLWVAGMCALLLAFSAGLFVRQRLIMPLRDPGQPYEAAPAQAAPQVAPAGSAANGPRAAAPAPAPNVTETAESDMRHTPAVKAGAGVPAGEANVRPRYMAPATVGASPALMESRLVYAPPPSYPMMAEMTRLQGRVTVEAVVGKSGRVLRAKAIAGHRLLRGAAVREVYQRRYRPYLLNDRPADVATIVTVDFRLR